jgi:hypothetical protein
MTIEGKQRLIQGGSSIFRNRIPFPDSYSTIRPFDHTAAVARVFAQTLALS